MSPADGELEPRDWLIAMVKEATGGKIPISDAIEIAARALAWHQRKLEAEVAKARIDELGNVLVQANEGGTVTEIADRRLKYMFDRIDQLQKDNPNE